MGDIFSVIAEKMSPKAGCLQTGTGLGCQMAGYDRTEPTFAQLILLMAGAAGARTAFGLPGVQNLAFWAADDAESPHIATVRHEQTTVYAADGWARATGGLGLALTTTGPGAANAVAAFGEAAACGSPVLLVASEVPTRYLRTDARVLHQSRDQAGLFRPLAKAVFTPRTAEEHPAGRRRGDRDRARPPARTGLPGRPGRPAQRHRPSRPALGDIFSAIAEKMSPKARGCGEG